MDEWRAQWGENIRAQRLARGWSQTQLAEQLDVTRAAVSYWESGVRGPTDAHKLALARVFRCSVRNLFPLVSAA